MADITIVNGVYKPTYNWGAPSCCNLTMEQWIFGRERCTRRPAEVRAKIRTEKRRERHPWLVVWNIWDLIYLNMG